MKNYKREEDISEERWDFELKRTIMDAWLRCTSLYSIIIGNKKHFEEYIQRKRAEKKGIHKSKLNLRGVDEEIFNEIKHLSSYRKIHEDFEHFNQGVLEIWTALKYYLYISEEERSEFSARVYKLPMSTASEVKEVFDQLSRYIATFVPESPKLDDEVKI